MRRWITAFLKWAFQTVENGQFENEEDAWWWGTH